MLSGLVIKWYPKGWGPLPPPKAAAFALSVLDKLCLPAPLLIKIIHGGILTVGMKGKCQQLFLAESTAPFALPELKIMSGNQLFPPSCSSIPLPRVFPPMATEGSASMRADGLRQWRVAAGMEESGPPDQVGNSVLMQAAF